MTVSSDTEADIARLFHVEHWKVGMIATQLGIHEDVVRRVIAEKGHVSTLVAPQFSPLIAPYQGLIQETLGRYPHLCASRLFDMIVDRGYSGSMRTLRRYVMEVRPKKSREAFLRLNPLVGEQVNPLQAGVHSGAKIGAWWGHGKNWNFCSTPEEAESAITGRMAQGSSELS